MISNPSIQWHPLGVAAYRCAYWFDPLFEICLSKVSASSNIMAHYGYIKYQDGKLLVYYTWLCIKI